jgi:cytochrome c oxidase subunit 4
MSTATEVHEHAAESHSHDHPSDVMYVKVAAFLAFVTALEVGTYFWEDIFGSQPSTLALVLVLFPMMTIKFFVVCGWFMHLKYDIPMFRRIFTFGLILAVIVYTIAMFTFEFYSEDYLKFLRRDG